MEKIRSEVLYVKGMNSELDDTQDDEDMWDDRQLNSAYDKALRMASVEVAKRVAMSTNSATGLSQDEEPKKQQKKKKSKPIKKKTWTAGMPCRAVYEGDGLEYEAFVLRIINDKECIVRFLGYDNSEIVTIDNMKPSLGKEAQQMQVEQALLDKDDESGADGQTRVLTSDVSEAGSERTYCSPRRSTGTSSPKRTRTKKKKSYQPSPCANGFSFPGPFPMPMPNIDKFRGLQMGSAMELPLPPPPLALAERADGEDQAISSMLLSWYMSGYYTGLYQGLKRAKENQKKKTA